MVHAGHDPATDNALLAHPGIRLISLRGDSLTPRLWSEGLALSAGKIVAFTTSHCFVSRNWASQLLAAVKAGAAAAGGPFRLARSATMLDAAIFFLRYSAFVERKGDGATGELAGDNSAYARDAIPAESWSRESGFWELDVNRAIRAAGGSLAWVNDATAEFGRSFGFASICRHRFSHGRLFGKAKVADGRASRVRLLLGAPLVPIVLALRAGRRVLPVPFYRTRFLTALPALTVIAACWAAGEAAGALEA